MPGTLWWWATPPTSWRCCPRAWCRASCRSSAMASWSIPGRWWRRSPSIEAQGVEITPEQLVLSDQACLILPFHRDLDAAREAQAGAASIGTTRRGIGPAYEDKVGRRALRVADLADPEAIAWKIERLTAHHNALRRGLDLPEIDVAALKARTGGDGAESAALRAAGLARARCGVRRNPSVSCSRARRACCSMSTTAPIRSSPPPTWWRGKRRRDRAWARARSLMCWGW